MISYYRRFIPHCANLIWPLTDLCREFTYGLVELSEETIAAFNAFRNALASANLLVHFVTAIS